MSENITCEATMLTEKLDNNVRAVIKLGSYDSVILVRNNITAKITINEDGDVVGTVEKKIVIK
jgi:hypothetical protein